jgi:hypothetical protein
MRELWIKKIVSKNVGQNRAVEVFFVSVQTYGINSRGNIRVLHSFWFFFNDM